MYIKLQLLNNSSIKFEIRKKQIVLFSNVLALWTVSKNETSLEDGLVASS